MEIIPRHYQNMAVKAAVPALRTLSRALVVMATGLGKTLTAALIAKELRSKRILFLVHSNFILNHAFDEFSLVFDSKKTKMAIYNGMSKNGASDADIVFATWQTMGVNLKQWAKNHFDLIIVDEAHHTEADTYRPVIKYFKGQKLGVTATPDRSDKADIRDIFGKEVINITLEEAVARNWLPRIEYHVITDESLDNEALQKIASEIKEGKKRFTMAEVNRRIFIKKRDHEIAKIVNGYNEKAVVFCASIGHAERMGKSLALASTFHSQRGYSADDTWNKNQKTLDALKNGIVRRVCAVNAFNEGVNVPSVGLVAFCRVTGVLTVFRQQLGRGMRPGKDKLIVLDFVGNLERIKLVIEMMNKISDLHEEFTPKEEIEREGYTRQKFEVSGKGFKFTFSDKIVDLMKVLEHCESEFYPTWQEASLRAQQIGIRTYNDYRRYYRKDTMLPSHPDGTYKDFPGWSVFLNCKKKEFYKTWQEASRAVQSRGFVSRRKYDKAYKIDPRLPGAPHNFYPNFPGWTIFLGGKVTRKYKTFKEAEKSILRLGVRTQSEYKRRWKEDPQLPSHLDVVYPDFPGWRMFKRKAPFYRTWKQASRVVIKKGISKSSIYRVRYKEDPRLPCAPDVKYPDFPGWDKFLGKKITL